MYCVRRGFDGKDEVLLDANTLSPDKSVSVQPLDIAGIEEELSIQIAAAATTRKGRPSAASAHDGGRPTDTPSTV